MTLPPQAWGCDALQRHPMGALAREVLRAALDAADPRVRAAQWARVHLHDAQAIRVLAVGKAAAMMAAGVLDAAGGRVVGGLVVAKHAVSLEGLSSILGEHPVPGASSLAAGEALLEAAAAARAGETVVALVSGGASALAVAPAQGVSLDDLRRHAAARLRDGTPIEAFNAQRRAMSRLKAGGLARAVPEGIAVHAVVLGDVIGAGPHAVGSGPLDDPRVITHLLADNVTAVMAAAQTARRAGAEVEVTEPLTGEARVAGVRWAQARMGAPPTDAVRCTIAGGETVVTVRGEGRGGRNQELALAAAPALMGNPHALLVTLATDGEDGPTDAAGAAVDGTTIARAVEAGTDPDAFLRRNDAYGFFDGLGDLVRTGPTGTNVGDLTILFS